jgi:pimeloyl-ACP methyl ester carboxylesterase
MQNPVIVIPGITASDLFDDYPLKRDTVWSMILNHEYDRIALHPDDLRYEAVEPARVLHGGAFEIYNDLVRALRHELEERADRPTPVFLFPYDWRVDVRDTAKELAEFVQEVLGRTRLLKHYDPDQVKKVDLVGHSMGGLVITEFLAAAGRNAPVGKVATLGTPFLGSIEAPVKITTGMSLLSGKEPKERERKAARVTPSVYQLFPSFPGAAVTPDGRKVDLLKAENMQASVVKSLVEFITVYSRTLARDRKAQAQRTLEDLLKGARSHRNTVKRFDPAAAGLAPGAWLPIIGVGSHTRLQITVDQERDGPRYQISDDQFTNRLSHRHPDSRETGDGTVPLAGALAPFLKEEQGVCVMPQDLGWLEIRDRALLMAAGLHGILPTINLVQRLVVKHLKPDFRGEVWGRPVPGVDQWAPPIEGLKKKKY